MSGEGRRRALGQSESDGYWPKVHGDEAGRRSTLRVEHPMLPPHVDKLKLVVNERLISGQLRGYNGSCKADNHLIQRTYVETQHDVKNKDGVVTHQETRLDIVPTAYRDAGAR